MNGFDRLKEMLSKWIEDHKEDEAFKQTVNYLLTRKDLEQKYLNEEKTLEGLNQFIQEKGRKHLLNGWCYITNEVVYAWAVIYFSLPNSFLKINNTPNTKTKKINKTVKNNVVSLEEVKEKMEEKKVAQLSLFGGVAQ